MFPLNMAFVSGRCCFTCLERRCSQVVRQPALMAQHHTEIVGENTVERYNEIRSETVMMATEVTKLT